MLTPTQQAFGSFYDTYAPKLWGLILAANLPAPQSEAILTNTLMQAWLQRELDAPTPPHFLTRLIRLACQQGLPIQCLRSILTSGSSAESVRLLRFGGPTAARSFILHEKLNSVTDGKM